MIPGMSRETSGFAEFSKLLNTAECAQALGVSQRRVCQLVKYQQIAHIKFGKVIRFRQEHVDSFLKKHTVSEFEQPKKRTDPLGMFGVNPSKV